MLCFISVKEKQLSCDVNIFNYNELLVIVVKSEGKKAADTQDRVLTHFICLA